MGLSVFLNCRPIVCWPVCEAHTNKYIPITSPSAEAWSVPPRHRLHPGGTRSAKSSTETRLVSLPVVGRVHVSTGCKSPESGLNLPIGILTSRSLQRGTMYTRDHVHNQKVVQYPADRKQTLASAAVGSILKKLEAPGTNMTIVHMTTSIPSPVGLFQADEKHPNTCPLAKDWFVSA